MNVAVLVGRLTKDPELRYTPQGVACCTFNLAVDNPFAKTDPKADFLPIVVWRQTAESCAQYLKKGRMVAIEGRISTRNYDNNEGRKIYVTEIVANNVRFLGDGSRNQGQQDTTPPPADDTPIDISDDDLPF